MSGWNIIGDIVGVVFAVPTYGASLTISPNARKLVKNILGGGNDDNNSLNQNLGAWKIQNENWKALLDAQREEAKRLRAEKEENEKKINHNSEEITRLNAIINNPHSTEEEKTNARKRIVILEDENKDLKEKLNKISKKLDDLGKTPLPPSKPWSFPKLGLIDKVLITSGVVLLVYLIIPDKKK